MNRLKKLGENSICKRIFNEVNEVVRCSCPEDAEDGSCFRVAFTLANTAKVDAGLFFVCDQDDGGDAHGCVSFLAFFETQWVLCVVDEGQKRRPRVGRLRYWSWLG